MSGAVVGARHGAPIVEQAALFNADDLLLLEVNAGGQPMSEAFGAFSSRAGLFIPVGELSRTLDFAVTVDPETKRADGWVVSQSRVVSIDLIKGEAQAGGKSIKLPQGVAAFFNDDIYLRADLIEKIFPVKLKADVSAASLTITPTEKLPFQARLEREQRRQNLQIQSGGSNDSIALKTPYLAFTPPSIAVDFNAVASNHAPQMTGQAEIRAAGDLAYAGAQLYLSTNQAGRLTGATFLMERKDPDGQIAGPFGATRSDIGDTFTPDLPIGAGSVAGRGIVITSASLSQQVVFNKVDLRGDLPAGYEVELYVNEVLRGSQSGPVQGRYEFLAVPLSYGLNVIRFVFYGPRGERREEVRRLNVGGAQLAAGQTTYSFGVVQQGRTVLPSSADIASPTFSTPGVGDLQITGIISHGLTNATTVSAGFARYTPIPNDPREVAMMAVDTSWSGISIQADAARDSHNGGALAFGMAGLVAGASIVGRDAEYAGGFRDQLQPLGSALSPLTRDSTLWINAAPLIWGGPLATVLRFDRGQFINGETEFQTSAQVSRPIDSYLLSSTFSYQNVASGVDQGIVGVSGEFDVSRIVDGSWQVRGGLGYQLRPHAELNAFSLTADHNTGDHMALHLGVVQALGSNSETTFQIGNTWEVGHEDISLTASYTTQLNEVSVGVRVSLGYLFDPLRHQYRSMGPNIAYGGSAVLQAFTDRDGDGRMGSGDSPAPGVVVEGGHRPATTDAQGEAVVTGLGNGANAQLTVDTASIEDPYLTPPARVIRLVPRPGRVVVVPYALHETGEVEVNIVFKRPGVPARPLSALQIQLVSTDGEVVASGQTEYDGTLLLDGLRPGVYMLQIDPEQAARLHMELSNVVHVTIPKAGGFIGQIAATVTLQGAVAERPTPAQAPPATNASSPQASAPVILAAANDQDRASPAALKPGTARASEWPSPKGPWRRDHPVRRRVGAHGTGVVAGSPLSVAARQSLACAHQGPHRAVDVGARRQRSPVGARSGSTPSRISGWTHWSRVATDWYAAVGKLLRRG